MAVAFISSIDYSAFAASATRGLAAASALESSKSSIHNKKLHDGEGVTVEISPAGRARYQAHLHALAAQASSAAPNASADNSFPSQASPSDGAAVRAPEELSQDEQEVVARLRQIDASVRAHEQAHVSAGGRYAGAPSYTYTHGPDNKQYATAGEVPIDLSSDPGKPCETIEKMKIVQRAAMAPANPSGQDRAVYAQAVQAEQQAWLKLTQSAGEPA